MGPNSDTGLNFTGGRVYMLGYNKEDGTTTPRLDWKILDITFRVKMQSFGVSLDLILGQFS